METLMSSLETLDQDQAIVALFAALLVLSTAVIFGVALLRSLGRWGRVALLAGAAVVAAVWVLR